MGGELVFDIIFDSVRRRNSFCFYRLPETNLLPKLPTSVDPIKESPAGRINVADNFGFLGGKKIFLESLVGSEQVKQDVVSSSSDAIRTRSVFDGAQDLFSALQERTFIDTCTSFHSEANIDAALNVTPKPYKDLIKECNKDVGYIIWIKGDGLTEFPDIQYV